MYGAHVYVGGCIHCTHEITFNVMFSTEQPNDSVEAKSAEQPSEQQSNSVTSSEEMTTDQQQQQQQQEQDSGKEDTVISELPSEQEKQYQQDDAIGENTAEVETVRQQQVETIKSNESSSEPEKHEQTEQHAMESDVEPKDIEQPSESEMQQPDEHIDDSPPPLLRMEQQHQKEQGAIPQPVVESEEPPQCDSTEQLQGTAAAATSAGENVDVTTPQGDGDKEDEVAMETSVEPPPEANQAPSEDECQPELMPTAQVEQPGDERIEQTAEEPEVMEEPEAEEEPEPQNEKTSEGEDGSVEMKEPEQVTHEEAPTTAVASMEDNSTETEQITEEPPKDSTAAAELQEPEQITEEPPKEGTAELKEMEHITEELPSGEQQPVKDRVAAESFTLELDEDPLGNSSIFMEDEHSNEVLVDPDTSPPASKKRKGKPRKLGTRTTRSRVYTCVYFIMYACNVC